MTYIHFGGGPCRNSTRKVRPDEVKHEYMVRCPFTGHLFRYFRAGSLWNGIPNYEFDEMVYDYSFELD